VNLVKLNYLSSTYLAVKRTVVLVLFFQLEEFLADGLKKVWRYQFCAEEEEGWCEN